MNATSCGVSDLRYFQDDADDDADGDDGEYIRHSGYAIPFSIALIHAFVFIPALVAAVFYWVFISFCTVVLWFRGVWGILEWTYRTRGWFENEDERTSVMPGAWGLKEWKIARRLADLHNYSDDSDYPRGKRHFNVEPLLRMNAGLDMGVIASSVKKFNVDGPEQDGRNKDEVDGK